MKSSLFNTWNVIFAPKGFWLRKGEKRIKADIETEFDKWFEKHGMPIEAGTLYGFKDISRRAFEAGAKMQAKKEKKT